MKNRLLKGLTLLVGVLCAVEAEAQSIDTFKSRLAQPVASASKGRMATVTVKEYGTAATAVSKAAREAVQPAYKGYRVCIFVDNGAQARGEAVAAKELFEENFPGVEVYMAYENPYFRVTVGNCLTAEEAIILKGRVAAVFPKAFPKSETLSLADFVK